MPALTYSVWQQSKVGTGLGGQLPFTGPASALHAHAGRTPFTNLLTVCALKPM